MKNEETNKKKILIVTAFPTHGAGSGALITTQAKSYVENGDEVVIITGNNRTDFDKLEGVKYHIVPFTAESENAEKIEGQCPFNYLMFTTHTESTANFWNVGLEEIEKYNKMFEEAIKEEVEEFKPDIIHAQHNWLTSSICNNFGKPVALTIHGTDLMGYKKAGEKLTEIENELKNKKVNLNSKELNNIKNIEEIYAKVSTKAEIMRELKSAIQNKKIEISKEELGSLIDIYDKKKLYELYRREAEKSAKESERIIVISDAQEKDFNGLFPGNESRVKLLENGYDAKVFHQKENVNREEILSNLIGEQNSKCDNVVLFVGKFADFKGIDALLEAAKIYEEEAEEKNKKIETIIVGSGALEETLKNQAETLELKHTHFVGRKNHSEICDLQNIADVSLIPSRNEPFGLVVIEGTSCGHPVIATNSGGIPGILNTEKEDLSDISKTYITKLGVLVPPLPERPSKAEEENTPEYLNQYKATVDGISKSVMDICEGNLKFDNNEIAKYTEKTYSQDVIRDKIMGIFEEAEVEHKEKSMNANDRV